MANSMSVPLDYDERRVDEVLAAMVADEEIAADSPNLADFSAGVGSAAGGVEGIVERFLVASGALRCGDAEVPVPQMHVVPLADPTELFIVLRPGEESDDDLPACQVASLSYDIGALLGDDQDAIGGPADALVTAVLSAVVYHANGLFPAYRRLFGGGRAGRR